jgi:hypothetical protein
VDSRTADGPTFAGFKAQDWLGRCAELIFVVHEVINTSQSNLSFWDIWLIYFPFTFSDGAERLSTLMNLWWASATFGPLLELVEQPGAGLANYATTNEY